MIVSILSRLQWEPKQLTYKQTGGDFPGGENGQFSLSLFLSTGTVESVGHLVV